MNEDGEKVIFNTSPTGSGKTFSWLKPLMENNLSAIAVYPTNALVEDQVTAAKNFHENHFPDKNPRFGKLTREAVSQKKKELATDSNGKAADKILRELDLLKNDQPSTLFTNPDTLILILKEMYGSQGQYLEALLGGSEMVVIDEFHMAEVKQRNDLLYSLSYLMKDDTSNIDKGILLSATPEEEAKTPLKRVFSNLTLIESEPTGGEMDSSKKIMPESQIEMKAADLFNTSERIKEDFEDRVLEICGSGRTVVMMDGLREVDQIHQLLEDELDLQVERIDGFHRGEIDRKLDEFDVLVSNSAVEVGVDFEVENLIFSAFDAPTFMQRVGRLRNTEEERRNRILCFTDKKLAGAEMKDKISREELEEIVEEKLGENNRPESFTREYSVKEWVHHTLEKKDNLTGSEQDDFMELSFNLISGLFSTEEFTVTKDYLSREIEFINSNTRLLDTLQSLETYRGESFQALIYDVEEDEVKTYNLRHLLTWGKVEFMDKEEFRKEIPENKRREFDSLKDYVEGYCIYKGKIEEPRSTKIRSFNSGAFMKHLRKNEKNPQDGPDRLKGIALQTDPEIDTIGKLNQYVRDSKIAVKSANGNPSKVQILYSTSDYLMLHYTETPAGLDEMSTAFGLDAFYLTNRIRENQLKDSNQA